MKTIRSILLGVLFAFALFYGIGFLLPKKYQTLENIVIRADKETVYSLLKDVPGWKDWLLDSLEVEQDEFGVYHWTNASGKNSIEAKEIRKNEHLHASISMNGGAFLSESTFRLKAFAPDSLLLRWENTHHLNTTILLRYHALFSDFEKITAARYRIALQKLKSLAEDYRRLPANDLLRKSLSDENIEKWQKTTEILKEVGNLSGKTIAEIGAKRGYFSLKFAENAKKVISLEFHETLFEWLMQRQKKAHTHNWEVRFTGMQSPAINENEAEAVFMTHCWQSLAQPIFLERLHKSMTERAMLYVLVFKASVPPNYPARVCDSAPEKVSEKLKNAGFGNIKKKSIGTNQYLFVAKVQKTRKK